MLIDDRVVQCKHCGWQHFAITREQAEEQINEYNRYFNRLSKKQQIEQYGGSYSTIHDYEHCNRCGALAEMISLTKEIYGSTICPIIWEK
jgi:hypothetical protein